MSKFDAPVSILVTGGAGFLGRGIIRNLQQRKSPARITVYSRDEHKQYKLRAQFPHVRTVLGDVRDVSRLAAVMSGHDIVIHAAALKHIPEAERDTSEAIEANIKGSMSVAQAALSADVKTVVGISTDKAASPRNTYGATKMLMERLFQEYQRLAPRTRFVNVRYGNVVSSTGSVVPLFLDQIAHNHSVSITSEAMTRFWISIHDAVSLIEKAINDETRRGYTYVARCPAMRVIDVAEAVWQLAGRHRNDFEVKLIGTRPGEKIHEVLVDSYEAPYSMDDENGKYILIPPAMSMAGEGTHLIMPYESSHPASWLTIPEMIELIEDARLV